MARRYPEEFKRMIVKQYQRGSSAKEICTQHSIARSTLFLWVKQYTTNEAGQIPREQYLMQKELERLRIENQIFKICGCAASSPLSDRLAAIDTHQKKFSLHALCRVLQVNRSTYYHHALRAPDQTQLQIEDTVLKPLVKKVFEKSKGCFGARKIRAKLLQEGHIVSERRVLRLMKELKLSTKGSRPKLNSANDRQYQYYPNKLKQNFLTDAPNKVWVSDITYAKVGIDFLYFCVIIDLYARKVVGYEVSESIDTSLVAKAFRHTFESRGKPSGLIFHSDQGSQYASFEFRDLLKRSRVTQSFSAPGTPYDNAVAESFFASIKKEDFRRNYYKTEEEFRAAVEDYIEFYNDYRPHQRLGFLTPNQAEKAFYDLTGR